MIKTDKDANAVKETEQQVDEVVHTEYKSYSGQAFLNDLLDSLNAVKDAGAKYVRCLFCNKEQQDLYNVTDIEITKSILTPNAPLSRVCIVFDNAKAKACETVEGIKDMISNAVGKIEENDIKKVEVFFAMKSHNGKMFKNFRYYYDDENDTVLFGVNVANTKDIKKFTEDHPGYGTQKNFN